MLTWTLFAWMFVLMHTIVCSVVSSLWFGKVLSKREGLNTLDGLRLVGLKPIKANHQLVSGSHLFNSSDTITPINDLGYITSSCYSPTLKSSIALGFLKNGNSRHGDYLKVSNPILKTEVIAEVCNPIFVDPNGDRFRE